jgi:hypothetical protein
MTNPKQRLTQIGDVYRIKDDPQRRARASRSGDLAASEALAAAVHEDEAQTFAAAAERYSLTTVEEIAALARVDQQAGTTLLADAGLPPDVGTRFLQALANTEPGQAELADWERYDRMEYELGCELDFTTPPPDEPPPPAAGLGAPAVFGAGAAGAAPPLAAPPVLPASLSLVDANISPIRDQNPRGTCVSFTAMACLEYYHRSLGMQPGLDLSEQFAYWNMVQSTGQRNLVSMYPLLKNDGSPLETTWPYVSMILPGNDHHHPPPPGAAAQATAYKCNRVRQLPPRNVDGIKRTLLRQRLVGIGIPVYKSWMQSAVVRKYGNITMPIPGEVPEAIGHAVALAGYEDDPQFAGGGYFIVRNSWGLNWGTASPLGSGYGTLPYRYLAQFNWDAWCIVG